MSKTKLYPESDDEDATKSKGVVNRVDFEPPGLSGEYYVGVVANQDSYVEIEVRV